MREEGGNPPGKNASKRRKGGVGTPVKGESSSSDFRMPSDAETLFGAPAIFPATGVPPSNTLPPKALSDDSPTVVGSSFSQMTTANISPAGEFCLMNGYLLAQRYEIVSQLGEGGMGAVYKAKDVELSRTVALKVIRRDLAHNRAILDRFKQELILATQVTHRNVVRIYDLGEADGIKFITMEYVEGDDLATVLRERTKLPPAEAVVVVEQVCRALEAAHN